MESKSTGDLKYPRSNGKSGQYLMKFLASVRLYSYVNPEIHSYFDLTEEDFEDNGTEESKDSI